MKRYNFYYLEIMHMIIRYSDFKRKVSNTCPTRWADGSKCSFADDASNKASMEIDRLIDLELI